MNMNAKMKMKTKTMLAFAIGASAFVATAAAWVRDVGPADDLVRVRDEIRAARSAGRIKPDTPITIRFAPGDYTVSQTLVLDRRDAGTENAPVTWCAATPGTVRFVGGRTIAASEFKPVSDARRKAVFSAQVRERILEADVSRLLPKAQETWPDAFHGMPPAPWIYQDGEPLEVARWPDRGWSSFTNVVDNGLTDDPRNEFAARPGIFYLRNAPNSDRWNLEEGVWADGYWVHDWDEEILRLASYDRQQETASPRKIHKWGLLGKGTCGMKGRRFRILNVAAELDAPGEWWLDRAAKKLYFLPIPGKENRPVVLATDAPTFFRVEDAAWIVFENFLFAYSHGRASVFDLRESSSHVAIRKCEFSNFAGCVVSLSGRDNLLAECRIEKTGDTPVCVAGGDRKNLVPAGNLVTRCDISAFGRFQRTACGVRVDGCGNAVRDCNIHHGAAQSLCYGGNEHLFANNDFHHVLLESCDAGAVYTGYDPSSLGNLLFGNFTHELGDDPALWPHRNGFYFDDCDWGDDAIGNRFLHTGCAIFIGGGNLHRIKNNLMVDALSAFHCDTRGVYWERRLRGSFLPDVEGHSWAEQGLLPFSYRSAPWSVAYPQTAAVVDHEPNRPLQNDISKNVFVNCPHPYSADPTVKRLIELGVVADNEIHTNAEIAAFTRAPQPIQLTEAERTQVTSPDGATEAMFYLDVAGRLSWQADYGGRHMVARSTLGVTVGNRDYGKLVVPGKAKFRCAKEAPVTDMLDDSDNPVRVEAKEYEEAVIPLRDLLGGGEVAALEVRVFDGGVAFRYRVFGEGSRRVWGEMTTWNMSGGALAYRRRIPAGMRTRYQEMGPWDPKDGIRTVVGDAKRGNSPRGRLQLRGGKVTGLVFPSAPRGWMVTGEVATPWRVTLFNVPEK